MKTEFDTTVPELLIDIESLGITDSAYEEISQNEMEQRYDESIPEVQEGTIITGKVVRITNSVVMIDVGMKAEGVIQTDEFENIDEVNPGDEIEILLIEKEDKHGNVYLSKTEADRLRAWNQTLEICEGDARVTGTVKRKVKGGLMVDIGGIEAFLPASQIALQNIKNIDDYINEDIEVKVIKVNHERRNLVVSRRELLDEERTDQKRKFLEQVRVGDVVKGMVKNITDFGAFIDLDGIDGLLHLTDMKWGRINHPTEILELNGEIDAMIIGIDYDKERVSLGIKQMFDNPWINVEERYPINSLVKGKIVNILPYGAFVELEEGIEGLIHISEFSWTKKVNHPSEFVSTGDVVETMVLSISPFDQKISLGLRQTQDNPWESIEERYPIGAKVKGTVRNVTNYGAFVQLEDGIDGLIHVSDMSWTRKINHPSEILKKGAKVDAVVISISPDEHKIALGIKQLSEDPWEKIFNHYSEGDTVTGKITNITTFGAFIQLRDEIEGLIHISELADKQVGNVKDIVQVGQEVTGQIIRIDPTERRIAISIKEHERQQVQLEPADSGETGTDGKPQQEAKRFESSINIDIPSFDKPAEEKAAEAPAEEKAPAEASAEEKAPAEASAEEEAADETPAEEEAAEETPAEENEEKKETSESDDTKENAEKE
ncbi:MAG: 30S ribosomal protein S1 [Chlamydiae bacterium]|nr:MAG: 30S ribosomal protein S1 [Chlamydiota bacterium]